MIPSGNFPTVESRILKNQKHLQMAVDLANITNGDIVIGCDPDGDRIRNCREKFGWRNSVAKW